MPYTIEESRERRRQWREHRARTRRGIALGASLMVMSAVALDTYWWLVG